MKKKFHTVRRIIGLALFVVLIGLPFLQINGQSAFRFDIPALKLLFFGTEIWMADFFIILVAILFLTFFALFVTTLLGRLWCGWVCPQTILVDATAFIEGAGKRGTAARIAAAVSGIAVSALVSLSLIGYFVSPPDVPVLIREGGIAAKIIIGSWVTLGTLIYLDLALLRRKFCATVCPYARLQSVLFDDRTLLVGFDSTRADECMECKACVRACPVGIDIRKGTQMECIHCADCIDACAERMVNQDRKSLIRYSFGVPGSQGTGTRVNPVITGAITALSLLFFIYLSVTRMPFDLNVSLKYAATPQLTDENITNIYELSFRNMTRNELALELQASMPEDKVSISPASVTLLKNADITRIPVAVTILDGIEDKQSRMLTITVCSSQEKKSISKTIQFMMPIND